MSKKFYQDNTAVWDFVNDKVSDNGCTLMKEFNRKLLPSEIYERTYSGSLNKSSNIDAQSTKVNFKQNIFFRMKLFHIVHFDNQRTALIKLSNLITFLVLVLLNILKHASAINYQKIQHNQGMSHLKFLLKQAKMAQIKHFLIQFIHLLLSIPMV